MAFRNVRPQSLRRHDPDQVQRVGGNSHVSATSMWHPVESTPETSAAGMRWQEPFAGQNHLQGISGISGCCVATLEHLPDNRPTDLASSITGVALSMSISSLTCPGVSSAGPFGRGTDGKASLCGRDKRRTRARRNAETAKQRQGRTADRVEERHMGDPRMSSPTTNNTKRDAFIKAVIEAAHLGEITHCEARELVQEWYDTYPRPGELPNLALVFFDRVDNPV